MHPATLPSTRSVFSRTARLSCFHGRLTVLTLILSKISGHWPRTMSINRKIASTLRRTYGRRPRRHLWEDARAIWSRSSSILSRRDWEHLWKIGEDISIDIALCLLDDFWPINPLGEQKKNFRVFWEYFTNPPRLVNFWIYGIMKLLKLYLLIYNTLNSAQEKSKNFPLKSVWKVMRTPICIRSKK
jgi:hypothetical protein